MEIVIETPQIQDPKRHVKTRPKIKKPNLFAVILVNDNFTTMEFVIYILTTIFEKSEEESVAIMLNVHKKGKGTAGIYPFQIAEQKAYETKMAAQANEYPLQVELDEIDS